MRKISVSSGATRAKRVYPSILRRFGPRWCCVSSLSACARRAPCIGESSIGRAPPGERARASPEGPSGGLPTVHSGAAAVAWAHDVTVERRQFILPLCRDLQDLERGQPQLCGRSPHPLAIPAPQCHGPVRTAMALIAVKWGDRAASNRRPNVMRVTWAPLLRTTATDRKMKIAQKQSSSSCAPFLAM
jgi:hypothetical protein